MSNENNTVLPQLFVLLILLIGIFIFNPNVKKVAFANTQEFMKMYSQIQQKTQSMPNGSDMGNLGSAKKISPELYAYLKENGYVNSAEYGKKMVIYTNVYDLVCPYQETMLRDFEGYKNSPDWTKKYSFIEHRTPKSLSLSFESSEDAAKFHEFNKNCSIFCVIDFENGTIYRGTKKGDTKYLYETLAQFYR